MLAGLFIARKCLYVGILSLVLNHRKRSALVCTRVLTCLIQNSELLFVLLSSIQGHFDVSCIWFSTALQCCGLHTLLLL